MRCVPHICIPVEHIALPEHTWVTLFSQRILQFFAHHPKPIGVLGILGQIVQTRRILPHVKKLLRWPLPE